VNLRNIVLGILLAGFATTVLGKIPARGTLATAAGWIKHAIPAGTSFYKVEPQN